MTYFGWEQAFNRARQAVGPIVVTKNNVGPLPREFEVIREIGILYRSYKRQRLGEVIVIREFPTHFSVDARQTQDSVFGQSTVSPQRGSGLMGHARDDPSNRTPAADAALLLGGGLALRWALKKLFGEPVHEKTYKLFISHSWSYEDQYKRLKEMLDDIPGFEFLDYSVRQEDPLNAQSRAELRRRLTSKIKQTSAVVIISGMYASYSDIIEMEIDISNELDKPIIGVKPRGNKQIPKKVQEEADVIVGWKAQSIVNAVKEHA